MRGGERAAWEEFCLWLEGQPGKRAYRRAVPPAYHPLLDRLVRARARKEGDWRFLLFCSRTREWHLNTHWRVVLDRVWLTPRGEEVRDAPHRAAPPPAQGQPRHLADVLAQRRLSGPGAR